MSATVYAGIVGAMVTSLATAPAVSSQIDRARLRPIAASQATAVVVRIHSSTLERSAMAGAPVDCSTLIAVECYARSSSTSADLAADSLLAAVYARLAADSTLGGLVGDIYPSDIRYDFDADAEKTACITLTYTVQHRAANLTL